MLRRNIQRRLGFGLAGVLIECRPDRQAAGDYLLLWDTSGGEFVDQGRLRDEIAVHIGVLHAGTAGIVRGHKAGGDGHRVPLQHGGDRQGGENVDADDVVVLSVTDELIQPLRPGGQIAVHRGALPEHGGPVLHVAVPRLIELGGVTVDAGVPVADEAGGAAGDELQRVHDLAALTVGRVLRLYGLGAGVMPLARIAAQYQRAHV